MDDCAVLIISCDKYEKFWSGFFNFFNKHWDKSIPLPIYFANENKDACLPNYVKQIKNGEGSFVQNLKKTLNSISETEIFLILEDFWLIAPMTSASFNELYVFFKSNNLDAFQISPYTPYYKLAALNYKINNQTIWKIEHDSDWLFNFQIRLWKKSSLLNCLTEPLISENLTNSAITVEMACNEIAKRNKLKVAFLHYFWYPIGGVAFRGEFTEIGKQMQNVVAIDDLVKNLILSNP